MSTLYDAGVEYAVTVLVMTVLLLVGRRPQCDRGAK